MKVPVSLCLGENCYFPFFFLLHLFFKVKVYLMVMSFMSLMTHDFEHLFMCFLAIRISSLEKYIQILHSVFH